MIAEARYVSRNNSLFCLILLLITLPKKSALGKVAWMGKRRLLPQMTASLYLGRVGRKITAWLFAEAAQPLAERDYQMLRTHSGVAPVTKHSGKRRLVVIRRGCNPRLRHALYHMARVAMQCDAHFNSVYAALRAKGQRHGQALRNIGGRLLRILMAMLRHRTCYDASRIRREPVVQMG